MTLSGPSGTALGQSRAADKSPPDPVKPADEARSYERSTLPRWLRCLLAQLYRYSLIKIRSPWSTILDLVIPIAVVLVLLWPRSLLKEMDVDEARYLSDPKYENCPFAGYGPLLFLMGAAEDVAGSFMSEDVLCQRKLPAIRGVPASSIQGFNSPPQFKSFISAMDRKGIMKDITPDEESNRSEIAAPRILEAGGGVGVPLAGVDFFPFMQKRTYDMSHIISLILSDNPVEGLYAVNVPGSKGCDDLLDFVEAFLFKLLPTDDTPTIVGDKCMTLSCTPALHPETKLSNLPSRLKRVSADDRIFTKDAKTEDDHAIAIIVCHASPSREGGGSGAGPLELTVRLNPLAVNGTLPEVDVRSFPRDNRDVIFEGSHAQAYASALAEFRKPSFLDFESLLGGFLLNNTAFSPAIRKYLHGASPQTTALDSVASLEAALEGAGKPPPSRAEVELMRLYRNNFDSLAGVQQLLRSNASAVASLPSDAARALCLICSPQYDMFKFRKPNACTLAPLLFDRIAEGGADAWQTLINSEPHTDSARQVQTFCYSSDVSAFVDSVVKHAKAGGGPAGGKTTRRLQFQEEESGKGGVESGSRPQLVTSFLTKWVEKEFLLPEVRSRRKLQDKGSNINSASPSLQIAAGVSVLLKSWVGELLQPLRDAGVGLHFRESAYPNAPAIVDRFNLMFLKALIWGLLWVSIFLFPLRRVIKQIMTDKELRVRETFKIVGCSEGVMWGSIYVFEGIYLGLLSILLAGIATQMYRHTSMWVTFCLLWCFGFACISYCILISAFFSRPRTALIFGLGIFYLLYNPFSVIESSYRLHSTSTKLGLMLFFTAAFCWGHQTLLGLQVAKFQSPPNLPMTMAATYNGVSVGQACGMLLVDAVLYFVVGWYFHQIFPGEYGVPRPWYFPLTLDFWLKLVAPCLRTSRREGDRSYKKLEKSNQTLDPLTSTRSPDFFEPERDRGKERPVIEVENVQKVFTKRNFLGMKSSRFAAVKDVSFKVYQGQIFALLGHNGAGKTTVINMLIGMLNLSGGSARIMGHDIDKETDEARDNIGFCPQFNILFDNLSCEEHLKVYGYMKGVAWKDLDREISDILSVLDISGKRKALSKTLSGGQKRRLNVSIALVGGAKAIVLDEPSTGMDPYARRALWDTLRCIKKSRAIILTTHFMEEADVLGDKIGIMADGVMQCMGSSLFLKSKYGVGYTLTITKRSSYDAGAAEKLKALVTKNLAKSDLTSDVCLEIAFRVPFEASGNLADILTELQDNPEEYGVLSYSLSVTTLEEVFLSVTAEADAEGNQHRFTTAKKQGALTEGPDAEEGESDVFSFVKAHEAGSKKSLRQRVTNMKALLIKRALVATRDTYGLFCQLILPIALVLFALSLSSVIVTPLNEQSVDFLAQLTPAQGVNYVPQTIYYGLSSTMDAGLKADLEKMMGGCDGKDGILKSVKVEEGVDKVSMEDFLLKERQNRIAEGGFPNYAALFFDDEVTHVIHDSRYIHSMPMALTAMLTCAKQGEPGGGGSSNFRISHHPLPRDDGTRDFVTQLSHAVWAVVAISMIPSYWGAMSAAERVNQAKHTQHMAGATLLEYWSAFWIWDMCFYLIPFFLVVAIMAGYKMEATGSYRIGPTLVAGLLYGLSAAPFTYLLSLAFESPVGPQSLMSFLALFCSAFVSTIQIVSDAAKVYQDWLRYIILLLPHAALAQALLGQSWFWTPQRGYMDPTFRASDRHASVWSLQVTGIPILYLFFTAIGYFLLVLYIDARKSNALPPWIRPRGLRSSRRRRRRELADRQTAASLHSITSTTAPMESSSFYEGEDEDVKAERKFCESCDTEGGEGAAEKVPPVLLVNLRKEFTGRKEGGKECCERRRRRKERRRERRRARAERLGFGSCVRCCGGTAGTGGGAASPSKGGKIVAVRDLCFSVPSGQCFGFLGVNGAGKTTTIQMLSGALRPSKGKAMLCGRDITGDVREIWQNVGYCPQFDALFAYLTVSEHLYFYARLAGVDEAGNQLKNFVERVLETLGIPEKANTLARHLSGGQQRKLSVGLAFLKNPKVVFLDEPSSGVDPASRRKLWNFIANSTSTSRRSVILTTHSMEECEALCDRLAIMQGGRLLCIGPPSHLKARFGHGFQLEVTFKETPAGATVGATLKNLPSKLKSRASSIMTDPKIMMASLGSQAEQLRMSKVRTFSAALEAELGSDVEREDDNTMQVALNYNLVTETFSLFMEQEFEGKAEETERVGRHARWMVPKTAVEGLASLFRIIEKNKAALQIQDYAVSEASLEAIFVQFQNKAQQAELQQQQQEVE